MFSITRPAASTNKAVVRYSNTTGDVQDSKILIEDVTNTKDTSKKANVLSIPAEGGKKMVYGYCTDQTDGTSFIGGVFDANATTFPYAQGLAIGGTSGNLLWKGAKVATTTDLNALQTVDKILKLDCDYDVTSSNVDSTHGVSWKTDGSIYGDDEEVLADIAFSIQSPFIAGNNITFTKTSDSLIRINATGAGSTVPPASANTLGGLCALFDSASGTLYLSDTAIDTTAVIDE
jgi:hypothetical protein